MSKRNPAESQSENRLLTEKEVAAYIRMSPSFLQKARSRGCLLGHTPAPPHIVIGARTIRYRRKDIDAWIDAHEPHYPQTVDDSGF
jgi:predicted DNA-binding transcriptional regulator AlpA